MSCEVQQQLQYHTRDLLDLLKINTGTATSCTTATESIRAASAVVRDALATNAKAVNSANALVHLPLPALQRVLGVLDLTTRTHAMPLSLTCHALRERLLQLAHTSNRSFKAVRASDVSLLSNIQRSWPAPIKLSLGLFPLASTQDDAASRDMYVQLVSENLHRIEKLSLVVSCDSMNARFLRSDAGFLSPRRALGSDQWSLICYALGHPAPLLSALSIEQVCIEEDLPLALRPDALAAYAPALRTCWLRSIDLPLEPVPALAGLSVLEYTPSTSTVSLDVLQRVLDGLPALTTLRLHFHSFVASEWVDEIDGADLPSHHKLARVRVDGVYGPGALHRYLCALGVREFAYSNVGGLFITIDGRQHELCGAYPVMCNLALGLHVCEVRAQRHFNGADTRLLFRKISALPVLLRQPQAFAHLRTLTIHEAFWPEDARLPAAPFLAALCIVLGSCYDWRSMRTEVGVFHATASAWDCPALETVHFAYALNFPCKLSGAISSCSCHRMLSVSLADVYHFVATCILSGGQRIAKLKLSGVQPIDAKLEDCMKLLHGIADEVEVTAIAERNIAHSSEKPWIGDVEAIFDGPY